MASDPVTVVESFDFAWLAGKTGFGENLPAIAKLKESGIRIFIAHENGNYAGFFLLLSMCGEWELHTHFERIGKSVLRAGRKLQSILESEGVKTVRTYSEPNDKRAGFMAIAFGFRHIRTDESGKRFYEINLCPLLNNLHSNTRR